jgi:hypothetical protein
MMAMGVIGGVFGHALVVHFVKALGDDVGARRLCGAALLLTFAMAIPGAALACLWAPAMVAGLVPVKVQAQTQTFG